MNAPFINRQRAEAVYANRALVAEVHAHNCAVTARRRRGEDWTASHNQYRDALSEIAALTGDA